MHLQGTTDTLEVVTGSSGNVAVHASFTDLNTTTGAVLPGRANSLITTATTTPVVAAPGANTIRRIHAVQIRNIHASASNLITVQHDDGTNQIPMRVVTLPAGWTLQYSESGWGLFDDDGQQVTATPASQLQDAMRASSTQSVNLMKIFGTAKSGGSFQSAWLANPSPGVASPAYTAGSGYTCSRTTAGALPLANGAVKNRIATAIAGSTVAGTLIVFDRLWSCSGMGFAAGTYTVTTPGALPARVTDNGAGCEVWIEQFVAAGVASGTATINYVNAAGSNVSAVIPAVVSAPVAGQMQRFPISDGIRSVTSVVTSATWTSGSFGITIVRRLFEIPMMLANVPAQIYDWQATKLQEVPTDACLMLAMSCTTTTAAVTFGSLGLVDLA